MDSIRVESPVLENADACPFLSQAQQPRLPKFKPGFASDLLCPPPAQLNPPLLSVAEATDGAALELGISPLVSRPRSFGSRRRPGTLRSLPGGPQRLLPARRCRGGAFQTVREAAQAPGPRGAFAARPHFLD